MVFDIKTYIRPLKLCIVCKKIKPHHAKNKCANCYTKKRLPKDHWKTYYREHREQRLLSRKKYYEKNKKRIIKQHREYYHKKRAKGEFPYDVKKRYEYEKKYRKENPEIIKAINKRTQKKNKEKIRKYKRKYYYENRELILQKSREYIKRTDQNSKYYHKNKEKEKQRYKKYSQTEKGKLSRKLRTIKRWTLERNGKCDLTKKQIMEIFYRDKRCVYCNSDKKLELDHIIAITKSGETTYHNMVISCAFCNKSKSNKDVFEWCKQKKIKVPKIILKKIEGEAKSV